MSKARITYRFDGHGNRQDTPAPHREAKNAQHEPLRDDEDTKVIPLQIREAELVEDAQYIKEIQKQDSQHLNHFTTDYGSWSSPFDAEVERLERIIRESGTEKLERSSRPTYELVPQETRGSREVYEWEQDRDRRHVERDYNPETGYYDAYRSYGPSISDDASSIRYLRRTRTPWFKMVTSVSGAVVTGVLFGWFVLNLFTGGLDTITGPVDESVSNQTIEQPGLDGSQGDPLQVGEVVEITPDSTKVPEGEGGAAAVLDQEGVLRVNLPARSYVVLQHGVFSTKESAAEAQKTLLSKGFAGVSELRENYYVFAGLTTSRDDAILLKHKLDEAQLETFIKTYDIPAISAVKWNGKASKAPAAYFEKGNELVELISRLCILQLERDEPVAYDSASLQSLSTLHREWTNLSSEAAAGFTAAEGEHLRKMNNALNSAIVSLDAYQKNPSVPHIWQAQSAITQYTLLQRGLLFAIEAK